MARPSLEVADILNRHGEAFLARDVELADVAAFLDEELRAH